MLSLAEYGPGVELPLVPLTPFGADERGAMEGIVEPESTLMPMKSVESYK